MALANRDNQTPLDWARSACEAILAAYAPEELPPAGRWHYHQGIFLHAMLRMADASEDDRYVAYAKAYVDRLIDPDGNFYFARDELDAMMPGVLLMQLAERFEDRRYDSAADKLRGMFRTLNRTSEGGYWHKDKYPYQMWLDGLYMGGAFAMRYARRRGEPALIDMALEQERLMRKHMMDADTGLLYHAWDESRHFPWANAETGCSPEFWGRSLGWYGLALAEFLELVPPEHPAVPELRAKTADFVKALVRYQDKDSGLWYQVVNKGDRPDNWLETSCSSLFVYAIAVAAKHGCADAEDAAAARRGYEGLIARLRTSDEGRLIVPDICIGTSAGDYAYYVARPRSDNDLHGVGAFVLACTAAASLRG